MSVSLLTYHVLMPVVLWRSILAVGFFYLVLPKLVAGFLRVAVYHNNAMLYVVMAFLGLPRLRRVSSSIGIDYLSLVMGILQGQVQRLDVSLTVLRTPPCLGNTHC